jgi:hypothetical protein
MIEPMEESALSEVDSGESESESDDGESENSEDLMAVTVLTLAGYSNPQTMKVSGYLKRQSVIVLTNISRTNNFLDEDVAKRLSIPMEPCDQFEVKLADGRTLTCQGKCSRAKLLVQD